MIRRLALPVALALVALSAAPAAAIEGGVPDGNGHPNVGMLGFDIDGAGPTPPFLICTGSVISDRAFLTAAHCIENDIISLFPSVTWGVSLVPGSPSDPVMPGGSDYPACCAFIVPPSSIAYATDVVVDPQFDLSTFTSVTGGEHDLAILEFAPGTFAGVTPVSIVRPGVLGHLGAAGDRLGPQVTVVGYGTEVRDGVLYEAGYRKTGRASIIGETDNWLALTQTTGTLPRSAALCAADSGSPQFIGDSNVEVSVQHTGEALLCDGVIYAQRLDTPGEQAFLAPFLPDR